MTLGSHQTTVNSVTDILEEFEREKYAVVRAMSIAWYSPEAWRELATIPEARIDKSYTDYLRDNASIEWELAASGIRIERVAIDIIQMTACCHRHGYEIDGKGRAAYGVMLTVARDDPSVLNAPVRDDTREVQ